MAEEVESSEGRVAEVIRSVRPVVPTGDGGTNGVAVDGGAGDLPVTNASAHTFGAPRGSLVSR